ncbi:MAG: NPXTG-anchored protein [Ruminiclostridium sp.]|nr:NPXTG-anchored protein [Ruminiclostridium sp.]
MNIKKILAVTAASAAAVSMLAVSASAYDINKDLKTGWSVSTVVPAEEFEGATTDSVFTLTYTADASIADIEGQNYWCVKPMINDTGWPFVDSLVGPELSENKDTYVCSQDGGEIKFTIPAEELEHIQTAGLAFMGHGITLGTLTFSNDETLAPAAAPVEEAPAAAPAEEAPAASGDVAAASDSSKGGNPATGVEDIAGAAAVMLASAGLMAVSRKRK